MCIQSFKSYLLQYALLQIENLWNIAFVTKRMLYIVLYLQYLGVCFLTSNWLSHDSSLCMLSCYSFAIHRVMLLEFSQYLENYLWPNYSSDATDAHVLSIVVMVNEKFRERVPAWEVCLFSSQFTFSSFVIVIAQKKWFGLQLTARIFFIPQSYILPTQSITNCSLHHKLDSVSANILCCFLACCHTLDQCGLS